MADIEKLPGSRLSISHLEQIIPIHEKYKETHEITYPNIQNPDRELIEESAFNTFRGTQIHTLLQHLYLFEKRKNLSVKKEIYPNYQDLKDTFPSYTEDECEAYTILYEKYREPVEVWRETILNSEIPKNSKLSTILNPEVIMGIWESVISSIDTNQIRDNLEKRRVDQMEMNEVLTVLNLRFDRNLQIPSAVDTLLIPVETSTAHMTVIDYKTGQEMDSISFTSKLQALLMSVSVYYNFIDKIQREKIQGGLSAWEVLHEEKPVDIPHFKRRPLRSPSRFSCSIDIDTVYEDIGNISRVVDFIYLNPITKKRKRLEYLPIARSALAYLNELNMFYAENKSNLKKINRYDYLTPQFVPQRILNPKEYKRNSTYNGTQIAFF